MKTILRLAVGLLLTVIVSTSAASGQASRLNRVMRKKLDHSKAILGAVVTSDWATLDRESRALARAVQDPAWTAQLTAPEYLGHSDAFQRAVQALIEASAGRDLAAASKAEVALCGLPSIRRRKTYGALMPEGRESRRGALIETQRGRR